MYYIYIYIGFYYIYLCTFSKFIYYIYIGFYFSILGLPHNVQRDTMGYTRILCSLAFDAFDGIMNRQPLYFLSKGHPKNG
jgi:hypothetical protein